MRNLAATPDSRLADFAGRRHGVVTIGELAEIGLDRWAVKRRVESGRLHRLHRGVYAVGHTAVSQHGRWLAAVLASGEGALLSHRSAAALWGMLPTVGGEDRRDRSACERPAKYADDPHPPGTRSPDVHLGIPVTSPRCTLDDLAAAKIAPYLLSRATEAAERMGVDVHEDIRTKSPLEDAFLKLCEGEPPRVNELVEGIEVDFHWPAERLVVETDGREHHETRSAFERDRARDQRLAVAGWTVLRFTHRQVFEDPARVRAVVLSVRSRSLATP